MGDGLARLTVFLGSQESARQRTRIKISMIHDSNTDSPHAGPLSGLILTFVSHCPLESGKPLGMRPPGSRRIRPRLRRSRPNDQRSGAAASIALPVAGFAFAYVAS